MAAKRPPGHAMQASVVDCAGGSMVWPAGHASQASFSATKVPGLHGEQLALPLRAVRPGLHKLHIVAPAWSANVFCLQVAHLAWPVLLFALPGMHGKHEADPLAGW